MPRYTRTVQAITILIMTMFSLKAARLARAEPATVAVRFKLTNLEYQPIAGVKVRLILGRAGDWQAKDAGDVFVTDANGEHRIETHLPLEQRMTKRPTNFFDS